MYYLFFCLFSIVPYYSIPTIDCESVQINHFHDENGRLVFDQLMCMGSKELADCKADICIAWFLLKNSRIANEEKRAAWIVDKKNKDIPYVADFREEYSISGKSIFWNNSSGDTIRINFKTIIYHTWTQYDPELLSRELNPKERYIKPTIYHR